MHTQAGAVAAAVLLWLLWCCGCFCCCRGSARGRLAAAVLLLGLLLLLRQQLAAQHRQGALCKEGVVLCLVLGSGDKRTVGQCATSVERQRRRGMFSV